MDRSALKNLHLHIQDKIVIMMAYNMTTLSANVPSSGSYFGTSFSIPTCLSQERKKLRTSALKNLHLHPKEDHANRLNLLGLMSLSSSIK